MGRSGREGDGGGPMRIYDLFPFFNELALLELRFAELDPLFPVYGLVELPRTFTDLPKPLYFKENIERFRGQRSIITYMPQAIPSGPHPTVDWFQRRLLSKLMEDQGITEAQPDDIIMLSDVDEIPNRDTVQDLIASGLTHPVTLVQDLFYHRVDLKDPGKWLGTVIAPRHCLGKDPDMQALRENRGQFPQAPNGGWHFSWMGAEEAIAEKLEAVDILRENEIYGSCGIQEPPKDPAFLRSCYEQGEDLFRRGRKKAHVPIEPGTGHPHEIERWLYKYPWYAKLAVMP